QYKAYIYTPISRISQLCLKLMFDGISRVSVCKKVVSYEWKTVFLPFLHMSVTKDSVVGISILQRIYLLHIISHAILSGSLYTKIYLVKT
ncbi:hypothetical protein GWI33_014122, partial [Rhynchophorus ferrugineus]